MENILNGLLKKVRASHEAVRAAKLKVAAWEADKETYAARLATWEEENKDKPEAEKSPQPEAPSAEKPEVPAEVTFETLLKGELAEFIPAQESDAVRSIQYWKTPSLMTRDEWKKNENFDDAIAFVLDRLKEDGAYNAIPAQMHRRLTKVLVRRLELQNDRAQTYEEVKDEVFDRFVEGRQLDRAAQALTELKDAVLKAQGEAEEKADDATKADPEALAAVRTEAWNKALKTWGDALGKPYFQETTGFFIGKTPPPAIEVEDGTGADEKQRLERRNFMWRLGYRTVEKVDARQDTVDATPGRFGRTILRDEIVKDRNPEIVGRQGAAEGHGHGLCLPRPREGPRLPVQARVLAVALRGLAPRRCLRSDEHAAHALAVEQHAGQCQQVACQVVRQHGLAAADLQARVELRAEHPRRAEEALICSASRPRRLRARDCRPGHPGRRRRRLRAAAQQPFRREPDAAQPPCRWIASTA